MRLVEVVIVSFPLVTFAEVVVVHNLKEERLEPSFRRKPTCPFILDGMITIGLRKLNFYPLVRSKHGRNGLRISNV